MPTQHTARQQRLRRTQVAALIASSAFAAMLSGELSQAEAIDRAVIATRQYAKRQRTWFRSRMADWQKFMA